MSHDRQNAPMRYVWVWVGYIILHVDVDVSTCICIYADYGRFN